MGALNHFCRAAEATPGLAGVWAYWRAAIGENALPWARTLLRATGELAPAYPKLGPDPFWTRPYDVTVHDEDADDIVGICPDDRSDRIALTRADLVIYEVDVAALARAVAAALGLVADPGPAERLRRVYRVGAHDLFAPGETGVYLTLSPDPADVGRSFDGLAARHGGRFLLFTGTRAGWAGLPSAVYRRGVVATLADTFAPGEGAGTLSLVVRPGTLFDSGAAATELPTETGGDGVGTGPTVAGAPPSDLITPSEQAAMLGWPEPTSVPTLQRVGRLRSALAARGMKLDARKVKGHGNKILVPRGQWEDAVALYGMLAPAGTSPDAVVKAIGRGDRPVNGSGEDVSYWCDRCAETTRTPDREPSCPKCGKHDRLRPFAKPRK